VRESDGYGYELVRPDFMTFGSYLLLFIRFFL
jgi:hypothetical protein